jgi:hypothetical protein
MAGILPVPGVRRRDREGAAMTTPSPIHCWSCGTPRDLRDLLRCSETGGSRRSRFVCRPSVDGRCFGSVGRRDLERIETALPEPPLLAHVERPALAPRPVVRPAPAPAQFRPGRLVATDATDRGGHVVSTGNARALRVLAITTRRRRWMHDYAEPLCSGGAMVDDARRLRVDARPQHVDAGHSISLGVGYRGHPHARSDPRSAGPILSACIVSTEPTAPRA